MRPSGPNKIFSFKSEGLSPPLNTEGGSATDKRQEGDEEEEGSEDRANWEDGDSVSDNDSDKRESGAEEEDLWDDESSSEDRDEEDVTTTSDWVFFKAASSAVTRAR